MRVPPWASLLLALASLLLIAHHPVQSAPGSAGRDVLDSSNAFSFLEALSSNSIVEAEEDAEGDDEGAEESSNESSEEPKRAHAEGVSRLGHYFMDDDAEEVDQAERLEKEESETTTDTNSDSSDSEGTNEDAEESSEGASTGDAAEAPPAQKEDKPAQEPPAPQPSASSFQQPQTSAQPAVPTSPQQPQPSAQPAVPPTPPTPSIQTTTTMQQVVESNKESTTTLAFGLSVSQKEMAAIMGQSAAPQPSVTPSDTPGVTPNDAPSNGTVSPLPPSPPIIMKYPSAQFVKNNYVTPIYDDPPKPTDKDYEIKAVQGTGGWKKAKNIPKDTLSPCNQGDPCPPPAVPGGPPPPLTPLQIAKIKADAEIQKKFDKPVVTPRGWLRPIHSDCGGLENCGNRVLVDSESVGDPRYVVSAPEPSLPVTNINLNCQPPDSKC
jgi:hypothetical protein